VPVMRSKLFIIVRKGWRAFQRARGGNVLITFGLASLPIVAAVGAAVDYAHANSIKAAMQSALDSTALIVARDAASQTSSQLQKSANAYFASEFRHSEVKDVTVNVSYTTTGGSQLIATASANMATNFMGFLGYKQLPITVSSTIMWGNSRLRVALVLDNTGSMSNAGKMTALKTATKSLLTQLQNVAVKNGDVYVSIIPFNKDVNVDPINASQEWLRWDLCTEAGEGRGDSASAGCGESTGRTAAAHRNWSGCVTDRDQDYDTTNTPPLSGVPATLFPAEQYQHCPVPLMGLSYDWAGLKSKIDSMQPAGSTNQAIGLQWGFQSLTSAPFSIPPLDSGYKYQRVLILLTDGLNTQNRWYTSQSAIDGRQKITCENIKAAGITIYTIQVNTDGGPTSSLLQSCASAPDKFFLLNSANQIVSTFQQIGTTLSNLRIAK